MIPSEEYVRFLVRLLEMQWVELKGPEWEVDHVVPVVEGGGECGLDNLRTLCRPARRPRWRDAAPKPGGRPKGYVTMLTIGSLRATSRC